MATTARSSMTPMTPPSRTTTSVASRVAECTTSELKSATYNGSTIFEDPFYDVFDVDECKAGWAIVESNHSGGSSTGIFVLDGSTGHWRVVANNTIRLIDTPIEQPWFTRAELNKSLNGRLPQLLRAVDRVLPSGRALVPAA